MDMTIRNGASAASYQPATAGNSQQRQQAFQSPSQSLASGDLAGAQQAFASLTTNQTSRQSSTDANSPLAQLGAALKSGDLSAAQTAFSALKSGHGHHHHGGGNRPAATSTPASSAPAASAAASGTGSISVSA